MKLYKEDYNVISDNDRKLWEELKEKEIIYQNGQPTKIKRSRRKEYPKAVRHFLSVFPNNFIDFVDIVLDGEELLKKLTGFETLIDENTITERTILEFINKDEAYFIIASILKNRFPFGHLTLYLFPEFKLPPNFQADYLLIGENSMGYHFVFVELENPCKRITHNDGSYGETIIKGLNQINDWELWLEQNFSNLSLLFEQHKKPGNVLTNEFRQFDATRIHFAVVAGRRSDYNEKTYRLNRKELERKRHILHYDNLIDYSKKVIGQLTD